MLISFKRSPIHAELSPGANLFPPHPAALLSFQSFKNTGQPHRGNTHCQKVFRTDALLVPVNDGGIWDRVEAVAGSQGVRGPPHVGLTAPQLCLEMRGAEGKALVQTLIHC